MRGAGPLHRALPSGGGSRRRKRKTMTRFGSIARLAALGGACLLGFAARAEVPQNGSAYMDAAFASVETMIKASEGRPTLPRLADPVEGKVLADVWDEPAILGKKPYTGADIPAL